MANVQIGAVLWALLSESTEHVRGSYVRGECECIYVTYVFIISLDCLCRIVCAFSLSFIFVWPLWLLPFLCVFGVLNSTVVDSIWLISRCHLLWVRRFFVVVVVVDVCVIEFYGQLSS